MPNWPRLMKPTLAASYCSMSVGAFKSRCPVAPVDFGDKRLEVYDIRDLDDWIETRKKTAGGLTSVTDALAEFKRANRRSREAS
jgi:hypothetical protein